MEDYLAKEVAEMSAAWKTRKKQLTTADVLRYIRRGFITARKVRGLPDSPKGHFHYEIPEDQVQKLRHLLESKQIWPGKKGGRKKKVRRVKYGEDFIRTQINAKPEEAKKIQKLTPDQRAKALLQYYKELKETGDEDD